MTKERFLRGGTLRCGTHGRGYVAATMLLAASLGCAGSAMAQNAQSAAQNPVDENIAVLNQWVDARKALATERAEWQSEKARLNDMIALRRTQLAQLNESLKNVQQEGDVAERERAELAQKLEDLKATDAKVAEFVKQAEVKARKLVAQLPLPSQQEIQPLTARLPKEGRPTDLPISQRLATIVGILSQIEKFNDTVDLNQEARDIDGRQIQVQTLYYGLAGAYWVDGTGSAGGTGHPGPNGWVWERDDALAPQIRNMIAMYNGETTDVDYVSLPANVVK